MEKYENNSNDINEDENDEITECSSIVPHDNDDENSSINSKAIVKLETVQSPATFSRLQCNTNLNMPPSNWLTNSANSYGLQHALSPHNTTGFTSFRMAHTFPECIAEIDVVSSAENIKNLLKLPYNNKSTISLLIHRIQNTLLIDSFDVHKYFLHQSENQWKWLRTFISEHIVKNGLNTNDRRIFISNNNNKSREALQKKNLLSKFLHYSLPPNETGGNDDSCGVKYDNGKLETTNHQLPLPAKQNHHLKEYCCGPLLPESSTEQNLPDPQTDHIHNRNVVWTFEDIRMLIGTDMPIFGSSNRPCISLRLSDMSKPINVLTGIDYWLDNLMCNVPEVVMCYHLDGLVQKYELIKTEDLPYLENSKFSPKVIRNVAQNILAFLKQNATKAGHTYWLFKGRNDDFVKLYDLTSLCDETNSSTVPSNTATATSQQSPTSPSTSKSKIPSADNKTKNSSNSTNSSSSNQNNNDTATTTTTTTAAGTTADTENPFTVPVAMLLYKVARNVIHESENCLNKKKSEGKFLNQNVALTAKQGSSIKALLDNCIKLLQREKYPEIVTSSHYILSDLFVPVGIDPVKPDFSWMVDAEKDRSFGDDQQNQRDDEKTSTTKHNQTDNCDDDGNDDDDDDDGDGDDEYAEDNDNNNESSLDNTLSVAVKKINDTFSESSLEKNWKNNALPPPPIIEDTVERCQLALAHIMSGLDCLQYFSTAEEVLLKEKEEIARQEEKRKIIQEELHPNMAKSYQAIPLPYEKLKPDAKLLDPETIIPMGWTNNENEKVSMVNTNNINKTNNNSSINSELNVTSNHITNKKQSKKNRKQNNCDGKNSFDSDDVNDECDNVSNDNNRVGSGDIITTTTVQAPVHQTSHSLLLKGKFGIVKSWNAHLKILLLEKTCLVYTTLAENSYNNEKYGETLKYIQMAIQSQQIVNKQMNDVASQKSYLLGRAADCYFQIAKNFANLRDNIMAFRVFKLCDVAIQHSIDKEFMNLFKKNEEDNNDVDEDHNDDDGGVGDGGGGGGGADNDRNSIGCGGGCGGPCKNHQFFKEKTKFQIPPPTQHPEFLMLTSLCCYNIALQSCASDDLNKIEHNKRLGNVLNELGVFYMDRAGEEFSFYSQKHMAAHPDTPLTSKIFETDESFYTFVEQSEDCLTRGVEVFKTIDDVTNLAILYSNMGRYKRFRAHCILIDDCDNIPTLKTQFYEESFNYYERALTIIGGRENNPKLWDTVSWEYFRGLHTLVQVNIDAWGDRPVTLDFEETQLKLMMSCLKRCEQGVGSYHHKYYGQFEALLYANLAKLHSKSPKLKLEPRRYNQLISIYFDKALSRALKSLPFNKYVSITLDRIKCRIEALNDTAPLSTNIKPHNAILDMFKSISFLFELIEKQINKHKTAIDLTTEQNDEYNKSIGKLITELDLFEKELQNFIKLTMKKFLQNVAINNDAAKIFIDKLKLIYSMTLRERPDDSNYYDYINYMRKVIENL